MQWSPVTLPEMKAFVGLKMAMGSMKSNNYMKYWQATSPVIQTPGFGEVMSQNHSIAILRYLCFHKEENIPQRGEPGYNKAHKIQELMDMLK